MNKYLEKIAANPLWEAAKATAGVGGDILKDVGRSVHHAVGGGYREGLVSRGIKNQEILRGVSSPEEYTKVIRSKGLVEPSESELKNLKNIQNKGIVKSLGYGGAALYGSNKLLNKIKERNQQQYYYQ